MTKEDDSFGTELYRYKREYRYALKIILGEIKPKKAVLKIYKEELSNLDKWFAEKMLEDLNKKEYAKGCEIDGSSL